MNANLIQVDVRSVYGKPVIYPACDKARVLAEMLGQKTLTPRDLGYATALGFRLEEIAAAQLKALLCGVAA
jgi:hypothetical protein